MKNLFTSCDAARQSKTRKKTACYSRVKVFFTVILMVTAVVCVHAEDWKGVNISDLSMTGEGYFEARITYNAMESLKNSGLTIQGGGFTLTSVDLIKSDGTTENLSSGSATYIDQSKFNNNNVKEGDYIRCSYSNKQNNYNPSFSLQELNNSIYKDGVASNEVYIYNVETGKFMYIGGAWGTHAELPYRDFGLKFRMNTDGDRYLFSSDVSTDGGGTTGIYLGMMQGYINDDLVNNGIVVDKKKATLAGNNNDGGPMYCYSRFKVERVSGETGDTYTYVLSLRPKEYGKDNYTVGMGSRDVYDQIPDQTYYLQVEDGLSVVETTDASATGHWRFVPVSEIDAAVRSNALHVDAFNGMNLDVTYKIDNQGFNRNNGNSWTESGAEYIKKGENNYRFDDNAKYNGKYFYGLLRSANANGTISRSFTAPATGWYKVQCQGVSKTGNAVVYAKANGNDAVTMPLNKVEDIDTYNTIIGNANDRVSLGIDFYNNKYPAEVYVHAEEGQIIELGVMQTAAYNTSNDLTAFDDFQIKFLGEIFVLDEDYTECTEENEYQTGKDGVTVVLHRTFSKKDDGSYYWNTLTLPIDMTGTQVKNVFGDDVKLAVASGLDQENPYCITFQTVNITNDGNAIEAGKFYLIQPAKEPATPAGQSSTINGIDHPGPLYTLGRRNVSAISGENFTDDGWDAPKHNNIRYYGTYLKKTGGVPAGSYVFSKGNMYHTTKTNDIKGFRFWIQDEEAVQGGEAKTFMLSISGVEDQQESQQVITSISGAVAVNDDQAAVYSLSGQFIGTGKQLLNRLPKGVYVINNKKYMVK